MDIKARLRERGISQVDLARRLGVSEPTVSKWVNRQQDIPTRYLRPVAEALATHVEDLLPRPATQDGASLPSNGLVAEIGDAA